MTIWVQLLIIYEAHISKIILITSSNSFANPMIYDKIELQGYILGLPICILAFNMLHINFKLVCNIL